MHGSRAVVTLALVCACAAHDCETQARPRGIRLDLTPAGLVVVPVEVNGSGPHRFVVDTGATTTMLDARFASRLGLLATGRIRIVTADRAFDAPTTVLEDLEIGAMRISGLQVSWMPLATLRAEDERISGVLGQDVLSRLTVSIDYRSRVLHLDRSSCSPGGTTARIDRIDGRAAVAARLESAAGRRDARLVIDSGANALILFEQHGRRPQGQGFVPVTTHAGAVAGSPIPRLRLVIGNAAVHGHGVSILVAEPRMEDGLLPASWFSKVCVDGPGATAVLTP